MYRIGKLEKEQKRMHFLLKLIAILICLVIIPIIITNIILLAKSIANPNKIPDIFGYKSFVIVSKSMEPTIKKNDAIFVKKVPENQIKVNDIIAFQDNGDITTHRVSKIIQENSETKYITKGDNNIAQDKEKVNYLRNRRCVSV